MIAWGSFLVVLVASIVGGCGVVVLFSLGLRLVDHDSRRQLRPLGILCFVVCGLVAALGVALVVPAFAPFLSSIF